GGYFSFCPQCDLGPCAHKRAPAVAVKPGRYREEIEWHGLTYSGPSDGMSTVPRVEFPPGIYRLRLSLVARPAGEESQRVARPGDAPSKSVALEYQIEVKP